MASQGSNVNEKVRLIIVGQEIHSLLSWSPWQTSLDGGQAGTLARVQGPRDHHLQLLDVVVIVQQRVLLVDLEVLQAEGDQALPEVVLDDNTNNNNHDISKMMIIIPEVVLDGEHAVLGPAVDRRVAER